MLKGQNRDNSSCDMCGDECFDATVTAINAYTHYELTKNTELHDAAYGCYDEGDYVNFCPDCKKEYKSFLTGQLHSAYIYEGALNELCENDKEPKENLSIIADDTPSPEDVDDSFYHAVGPNTKPVLGIHNIIDEVTEIYKEAQGNEATDETKAADNETEGQE